MMLRGEQLLVPLESDDADTVGNHPGSLREVTDISVAESGQTLWKPQSVVKMWRDESRELWV